MPKQRIRVPMGDWSGGLNEDANPLGLEPNQLRIARNVYWEGKALASRRGADRLTTSALNSGAAGVGVYDFVRNAGADRDIVAVFGTKMYENATDAAPSDITGAVTITAGQNNQCAFENFNEELIVVNGVDSPWKWTGGGSAALLGGSPPAFKTVLAKWNRVFGAGHASARRTIRYSDLGTHETWNAANTVRALTGDTSGAIEGRDWIQQLGHLGDTIFVGLANSIGRVVYTGDATSPFRYLQIAEFGCAGAHTYVAIEDHGYFLSRYGVHRVDSSEVSISFESSLLSTRRLRTFWASLNKSRLAYSTGALYRTTRGNLLVVWPVTTGSGSIHDSLLVMDITDGPGQERFTTWSGWDANYLAVAQDGSSRNDELLFTSTTGYVWQGDSDTNDHGSAYVAEAATRWEDFGLPAVRKNLRDLYIETSQSGTHSLSIDTIFDYATTPTQTVTHSLAGSSQAAWGTAVWGTDVWPTLGYTRDYLFALGDGVVMSWRFYTTGADQPWAIYKLVPAVRGSAESKQG